MWRPPTRLLVGTRVVVLATCLLLSGLTGALSANAAALVALATVFLAESLPALGGPTADRLRPVAGAGLVSVILVALAGSPEACLPAVLAPVVTAGLSGGLVSGMTAVGFAAAGPLVVTLQDGGTAHIADANLGPVLLLTVAVAGLAAWVRSIAGRPGPAPDPAYAAAYRLLSQLRPLSRSLRGGLDTVALAEGLLDGLRPLLGFDRAVVLAGGGPTRPRFVPLARAGGPPELLLTLEATAAEHPATLEAWLGGHTVIHPTRLDGTPGTTAVLIARAGLRTVAVVVAEAPGGPWPAGTIGAAEHQVAELALPLETALLFADVRSSATVEERRRVAREIHDGVAQQIAALGYVVDDLLRRTDDPQLRTELRGLRTQLTQAVGELRLSIVSLRADVGERSGLATAVADYAQQVGASAHMAVHLSLDEQGAWLPADVEAELLRIAQEAITNARRHSSAANLWVTCRATPDEVDIVVQDDGVGLTVPRRDSVGLTVMQERADRIGAQLTVGTHPGGGTRVQVRRSTVADRAPAWSRGPTDAAAVPVQREGETA